MSVSLFMSILTKKYWGDTPGQCFNITLPIRTTGSVSVSVLKAGRKLVGYLKCLQVKDRTSVRCVYLLLGYMAKACFAGAFITVQFQYVHIVRLDQAIKDPVVKRLKSQTHPQNSGVLILLLSIAQVIVEHLTPFLVLLH